MDTYNDDNLDSDHFFRPYISPLFLTTQVLHTNAGSIPMNFSAAPLPDEVLELQSSMFTLSEKGAIDIPRLATSTCIVSQVIHFSKYSCMETLYCSYLLQTAQMFQILRRTPRNTYPMSANPKSIVLCFLSWKKVNSLFLGPDGHVSRLLLKSQ